MTKDKVIMLEERVPTLRKHRRKKANKALILYLSIFFLLALFIIYFQSSLSEVKAITISGNKHIDKKEVVHFSGVSLGANIWDFNISEIETKIKSSSPLIKSVQVKRKFPSEIEIKIKEWQRMGYLYSHSTYLLLLENGKTISDDRVSNTKAEGPIFYPWDKQSNFMTLIKEFQKIPQSIVASISEVHPMTDGEKGATILIYTTEGYEIHASLRDLSEKMVLYPSMLEKINPKKKGIIDLNVGAYFKEYEKPASTKDVDQQLKNKKTTEDNQSTDSSLEEEGVQNETN